MFNTQSIKKYTFPLRPFLVVAAFELILAFSSIGYITVPPVSLTFVPIPVLVGAYLFGPLGGGLLGLLFGLTSLWKASTTAIFYADIIFSPFYSGNPLASLFLSVGARAIFGAAAGFLFLWAKRRQSALATSCVAVLVSAFHSFLVYATMQTAFPAVMAKPNLSFWDIFLTLNNCGSWLVSGLLLCFFHKALRSQRAEQFRQNLLRIQNVQAPHRIHFFMGILICAMFLFSLSLFFHFFGRMEILFANYEITIPSHVSARILHVGLQFLAAIVALSTLLSVLLLYYDKYVGFIATQAQQDAMTGLLNPAALESRVNLALAEKKQKAAFLMLDIDHFKDINDTYGHPFGDVVLKSVADLLRQTFHSGELVGRQGGDEFAAFIIGENARCQMQDCAERLCRDAAQLPAVKEKSHPLTVSIGISYGSYASYEQYYEQADKALYRTKQNGKNGYTLCDFPL